MPPRIDELTVESKLSIAEYGVLFGFSPQAVLEAVQAQSRKCLKPFYTFNELGLRWQTSRQNVYNILNKYDAALITPVPGKQRSKRLVSSATVERIERQWIKP